jgi:hypothetical protein
VDSLLERDGFELAVPREIGLVECIAVGAAQPIETAGRPHIWIPTMRKEPKIFRLLTSGRRILGPGVGGEPFSACPAIIVRTDNCTRS